MAKLEQRITALEAKSQQGGWTEGQIAGWVRSLTPPEIEYLETFQTSDGLRFEFEPDGFHERAAAWAKTR